MVLFELWEEPGVHLGNENCYAELNKLYNDKIIDSIIVSHLWEHQHV